MSNALNPNLPKEVRSFPFSPVRNSPFPPETLAETPGNVLKASSPPPIVLSEGIWPSGWMPCSKQKSSQHLEKVKGQTADSEVDEAILFTGVDQWFWGLFSNSMKPQHVVWSSVMHPTLYQNNRFDDETDDDIKRFLDFSKVSRCRSELLPGRSLDAWNCVPLIHLLTLNLRKKYLCLSLSLSLICCTCFLK